MDKGLHFVFCVVTTLLLLRESSQTGEKNDPKMLAASESGFVLLCKVLILSIFNC